MTSEKSLRRPLCDLDPRWTGNLDDDCLAHWNSYLLRAENMGANGWWWAVYQEPDNTWIDDCWNHDGTVLSGYEARDAALDAAIVYLEKKHE